MKAIAPSYADQLYDQWQRELGRAEDAWELYEALEIRYTVMLSHLEVYTPNEHTRMLDELNIALKNARRLEDKAGATCRHHLKLSGAA